MSTRTIRIETNDSELPQNWHIYLDGEDISTIMRGITIEGIVGEVARVRLDCLAKVEVVGEIVAQVETVEAG